MSDYTPNIHLAITPENTNKTFKTWRMELTGDTNSNMTKIDNKFGLVDAELSALKSFQSKVYGVKFTGSSPTGTRQDDAVGLTAAVGVDSTTVTNDFDSIYPWSEMRRCNGSYDANGDFVATAYEGDVDYAVDGTNGNVWVEIPQFWIKEEVDEANDTEYMYITPYETEGFRLPEKFIKLNGDRRAKAYIAAYESGKVNNVPVSISGIDPSVPQWSHNNFLTACANIGDGYCAMTMEDHELIKFLFCIEFATRNTQSIMPGATGHTTTAVSISQATTNANYVLVPASTTYFAAGYPIKLHTTANSPAGDYHIVSAVETYSEDDTMKKITLEENASVTTTTSTKIYICPFKTGFCDDVAASSGAYSANDGKWPIKYRGIENPWGNIWTIMSGVLVNEYQLYYLKDASADPVNSSAASITSTMTAVSYTLPSTTNYAKVMGYDSSAPTYRLTKTVGASDSTYYCDYFYQGAGVRCVLVGGYVGPGSAAGLFCFSVGSAPSGASWSVSSRLSYTG